MQRNLKWINKPFSTQLVGTGFLAKHIWYVECHKVNRKWELG